MLHRLLLPLTLIAALILVAVLAVAADPAVAQPCRNGHGHNCPTPTPTPTTPSPTPTSTSPTPTPTTTPPGGFSCVVPLGGVCGAYSYSGIPNSNGFNTYVSNQSVGPQPATTQIVSANNPGDWQVVANDQPYGYTGVQTFPDVQQLMNNWPWTGCGSNCSDTPLASLSTLKVTYTETSPTSAASIYEFAPDIWQDNYSSDVMFWVDTSPVRCTDNGLSASDIIGQAVLDSQRWTVYRNGGPGSEIIFILDGGTDQDPVGNGTCAQQRSGTVDVKAGLTWLLTNGVENGPILLSQVNTGWEITSADNQRFAVSSYSILAG
jgi:hypothetical protein